MTVPGAEKAVVPLEKIRDYLLSPSHPSGKVKASFFNSLGFARERPEQLSTALLSIVQSQEPAEMLATRHGTKYVVEGTITGPSKGSALVRTVWIAEPGMEGPRFVTAYPMRRGKAHEQGT